MATIEDQLMLEMEMVQLGIERYEKEAEKLREKGVESRTKYGMAIIGNVVTPLSEGIKAFLDTPTSNRDIAHKKLRNSDPERTAFLSLLACIDMISKKQPLMSTSRSIGMYLEDQDRCEQWLKSDKEVATNILKMANEKSTYRHRRAGVIHKMNHDGYYETSWSNEERIHVGLKMVDLIVKHTGIIELERLQTSRNKTTTYLKANDKTIEWIKGFNAVTRGTKPRYSPCIVPPRDWGENGGLFGGGYYIDQLNNLPFVRVH